MDFEINAAIIAGADDNEIEDLILINILGEGEDIEQVRVNFNFENLTNNQCKDFFRFNKDHITLLVHYLEIPNEIRTPNRNKVTGLTALCILLRRLAYPNRLKDLQLLFGLSPQSLSHIINYMSTFLINTRGHLLNDLRNHAWLNIEKLEYYSQAVRMNGGALPNCWGFIDGTIRPMCRPSVDQQNYYSGHKRVHCVKYQSIVCPDGLIVSLLGAYPGRRHDAGIFRESRIYDQLQAAAVFGNERFVIFGDQAYGIRELLMCPYRGRPNLLPHEHQFNASMKVLRTSVEWGFQKVSSLFAFIDYKKNLKLLLQDVESLYKIAVLFTNIHTCLYGSETGDFFNTEPPTVQEYLGV